MHLDRLSRHDRFGFGEIDVYFAAHSKLALQVHAGLDRKTRTPHQAAIVLSFKIVDICTIAMIFFMNGMAGAMKKPFAVARLGNGLPRRIIHLPTGERLAWV